MLKNHKSAMANLHHLSGKIEEIRTLITKLDKGTLSSNEMEELVSLSRDLYERSVILQYKSFEEKVFGAAPAPVVEEKEEVIEEPVAELEEEEILEVEKEEEPAFDFSLFDSPQAETPQAETPEAKAPLQEEPEVEEHISVSHTEHEEGGVHQETVEVTHTQVETVAALAGLAGNFMKIMAESGAESGLNVPLESLVGAFGLNERLQYINVLFGGSSENFAEGVKALDQLSSRTEASEKAAELAATYGWENDNEVVTDFLAKVGRRYA